MKDKDLFDYPSIFYPDCDLISELEEYDACIECYRYNICKEAWKNERMIKRVIDTKSILKEFKDLIQLDINLNYIITITIKEKKLLDNILKLLELNIPQYPIIEKPDAWNNFRTVHRCNNCHNKIAKKDKFCRECGVPVNWSSK